MQWKHAGAVLEVSSSTEWQQRYWEEEESSKPSALTAIAVGARDASSERVQLSLTCS